MAKLVNAVGAISLDEIESPLPLTFALEEIASTSRCMPFQVIDQLVKTKLPFSVGIWVKL